MLVRQLVTSHNLTLKEKTDIEIEILKYPYGQASLETGWLPIFSHEHFISNRIAMMPTLLIGDMGMANKTRYCLRNNYHFECVRTGFDASRETDLEQIHFIRRLPTRDWIFWADTDTMVMNHHIRLERYASGTNKKFNLV